jgi:hypothetical protein
MRKSERREGRTDLGFQSNLAIASRCLRRVGGHIAPGIE